MSTASSYIIHPPIDRPANCALLERGSGFWLV